MSARDPLPFDEMHGDEADLMEAIPEDVGFPERVYSDAEIDEQLLEENAIVRRKFIERATEAIQWLQH
jgi:hypothetical protein